MKILLIFLTVTSCSIFFSVHSSESTSSINIFKPSLTEYEKKVDEEYSKLHENQKALYCKYVKNCIEKVDPAHPLLTKISVLTQTVFEYFCLSPKLWKQKFDENNNRLIAEIMEVIRKNKTEMDALKNIKKLFTEDIKPNVNIEWPGNSPLLFLTISNKLNEITKLLIYNGANTKGKNPIGTTILMQAVAYSDDNLDIIELLLSKEADINALNNCEITALMYAAGSKKINIINLLLKHGAQIDEHTLNHLIRNNCGNEEIIKLLKEHLASKTTFSDSSSSSSSSY